MTLSKLGRVRRTFKKDSRKTIRVLARTGPLQTVADGRIDAGAYALFEAIVWGSANESMLRRGQTRPLTRAEKASRDKSDKSQGFLVSEADVLAACEELGIVPWIRKRPGQRVHSGIYLANKLNEKRAAKHLNKKAERAAAAATAEAEEGEPEEEEKKEAEKPKKKKGKKQH